MDKLYDRRALVRAYIQAHQPYYRHEDFKTYALGLLDALQRAFGITLSFESAEYKEVSVLWMLFTGTVRSYLSIRTPRGDFLDDSLLNKKLEQLGEIANRIVQLEEDVRVASSLQEIAHLELLDALFVLLWGPITTTVTSHDLRRQGFDDTAEPKPWDYLDDL